MKTVCILFICAVATYAYPASRSEFVVTEAGEFLTTEYTVSSTQTEANLIPPISDAPEVLWYYSDPEGPLQKNAYINYNSENVFSGGWYSPGTLYDGYNGEGSILWQADLPAVEPDEYCLWLRTGVAAAKTTDIYYQAQVWDVYNNNGTPDNYADDYVVSEGNTSVKMYSASSSTPIWAYEESGGSGAFIAAWIDSPGKIACSDDGSIFAVSGMIDGHLAVQFFNASGTTPYLTYENTERIHAPRQLRLTADGNKCVFRENGRLFRIDTTTGALEDTHTLEASCDCFAISPDGSVVAYGFLNARIAVWDGSNYNNVVSHSLSSHYGKAAVIAADNETVYFAFRRSSNLGNRLLRFDISSSTPEWIYDYPIGSGTLQDGIQWIDCSDNGKFLIASSWGCEFGGGDEIQVFSDDSPSTPIITINTPGSMYHADMSGDGQYAIATGKSVHANLNGAGTNLYFIQVQTLGINEPAVGNSLHISPINPNPVINHFNVSVSLPLPGNVSMGVFDLSGRRVQELLETQQTAGTHNMVFETDLSTGVYLCRIYANGEVASRKFVVTR